MSGCCHAPKAKKFIGARVSASATQDIPEATLTALTFDVEVFDRGALWTASAPTRFTITKAGYYVMTGNLEWVATEDLSSHRSLFVRVNGTDIIAGDRRPPVTGEISTINNVVSTPFYLAAEDYVELLAQHDVDDDLATLASDLYSPVFGIHKVG